jgi:hypothetical protein
LSALAGERTGHSLAAADRVLRAVSIGGALLAPVTTFVAEFIIGGGGVLHLVLAAVAAFAAALFLLRNRGVPGNGRAFVVVALSASLAWLVGVVLFAFLYSWLMRDFH